MSDKRKIIVYPDATLQDLDAGVTVAYPLPPEHWSNFAYYVVPSFLIIGAQKCGTAELRTWLSKHPKLLGPKEECHFFDEVADLEAEWQRYIINRTFLVTKSKTNFDADLIQTFEKTPEYLDRDNQGVPIPQLVRQLMPSGKFIVLLRDPTKRAYSAYQMERRPRRLAGINQEYADSDFHPLIRKLTGLTDQERSSYRLLTIGHYAAHLEKWFQYFPREQFLILCLEEFQRNPFSVMAQVQEFLNLPLFDYRPLTEKNFRGWWVLKEQDSKGNRLPYDPMPDAAKQLLDDYYAPWNRQLKQLLPTLHIPWG